MHLTLAFIGEVGESGAAAVVDAMASGFPRPPFPITFDGLGVFPPRGAPRVVWLGVTEGDGRPRSI